MASVAPQTTDPGKRSREAAGIPVVPALDGFRALAVLGIVFAHVMLFSGGSVRTAGTVVDELMTLPRLGVDLLFVVSGFVMFLPTAARGGHFGSIANFARRRAARLFPAAWVVLAIVALLLAFAPPSERIIVPGGEYPMPGAGAFLGHFLFLHTPIQLFDLGFPKGLGIIGPFWTLSLELIFYLLLPFIAAAWFRRPWLGLALSAAISIGWHVGFANLEGIDNALDLGLGREQVLGTQLASDYQFPAYAFSFGAGMTSAYVLVRLQELPAATVRRWIGWAQAAALAAVLVCAYLASRYGMPGQEMFAGPAAIGRHAPLVSVGFSASVAALMVATALASRPRQWLVSSRLAAWLADRSYGIYLIHYPLLAYMVLVLALPQNGTLRTIAIGAVPTFVLSILWGAASARWIEHPARRWAHRRRRSPSTPPAAPAGNL
jgi:peptidoglycan/LPS O-acetylase OafA/YrhL